MGFFSKRKEAKNRINEWEKSVGVIKKVTATHSEGLPIGNSLCYLYLCQDKLIIKTNLVNSDEFIINNDKLNFAYVTQEKETLTKIKSSIGKAAVGGVLFGSVGAIIGAMPKSTEKVKEQYYLTIGYINKNNQESLIIFENNKLLSSPNELGDFTLKIKDLKVDKSIEL